MNDDDDNKKSIGRIALSKRAVGVGQAQPSAGTDLASLKELSEKHGVPALDLQQLCLRLADLELIPREIAERHVILPVLLKEERLFVAMANPQERRVIDELQFVTGKTVFAYVAFEQDLLAVINAAYRALARGEEYYVGPACPPEVLAKVGLSARPPRVPETAVERVAVSRPRRPAAAPPSGADSLPELDFGSAESLSEPMGGADSSARPPAVEQEPLEFDIGATEEPGGVVGNAMQAESRDVDEADFGELSEELSVVTDVPDELESGLPDGKTVLIVDDEPEIRAMLARLAKSRGHRTIQTHDGRTALRLVKEHSPDLILLDAMLPEVHGFEIARRIRGSERYGHIPIIMISAVYRGWRYAEDLRESCGVRHYIEKPFKIADVQRAMDEALAGDDEPSSERTREISDEAERKLNQGVEAYRAGRIDEAIELLRKGVELDPLAYRLHFHLGLLYAKKGRVYDAISELERAVEMNSRHFPGVKNLAILYQKAGFRNKATEMWERAMNLAPDDAARQSIKDQLLTLLS